MEFLRFGSSIPGSYWGCCAMCIIQNFKFDPDEKASIEIVSGDGGEPIGDTFAGLTYRQIFETRLRIGTFSTQEMPNHGFLAILADWQIHSGHGKEWLKILHANGFEFLRTVDNSVYSGANLLGDGPDENCDDEDWEDEGDSNNKNHLFGLFRNIGHGAVEDPFTPPAVWTELDGGVPQVVDYLSPADRASLTFAQRKFHLEAWNKLGPPKFYTKQQVLDAGVTVTLAGKRSKFPQQTEKTREAALKQQNGSSKTKAAPFTVPPIILSETF